MRSRSVGFSLRLFAQVSTFACFRGFQPAALGGLKPATRVWTFLPSPVSGDVNSPSFKGSVISTIFLTASAVDVNSPGFQAGVGRKKRLPPRRGG